MNGLFFRLLLIFGLISFASASFAQPPDTLWTRTFFHDEEYHLVTASFQVADGGFVIVGQVHNSIYHAYIESFALKLDSAGNEEWYINFAAEIDEIATVVIISAIPTSDGAFACAGIATNNEFERSGYVIKADLSGGILWSDFLGELPTEPYELIETTNGNLLIGSNDYNYETSQHALSLAEYSSGGNRLWYELYTEPFPYSNLSDQSPICLHHDGGYLIAKSTPNPSYEMGRHIWLVRVDQNGELISTYRYPCSDEDYELKDIINTSDSGYIIAGSCNGWAYLTKLDGSLDIEWERTRNPFWAGDEIGRMVALSDGGVAYGGYLEFSPQFPNSAPMIARLTANGDTVWTRYFFIPNPLNDAAIGQTFDGGFIAAMSAEWPQDPNTFVLVVRIEPDTIVVNSAEDAPIPRQIRLIQNYPNPFNAETTISFSLPHSQHATISVYDLTGRRVSTLADEVMNAGEHSVTFDASGLPSGIYFARMTAGNQMQTQKMVLLK